MQGPCQLFSLRHLCADSDNHPHQDGTIGFGTASEYSLGVNYEGYREILGVCEGAKEDKAGWSSFLKHLKERGLTGVQLIISDACMGLAESAVEFFPDAAWQRCVVHWYRNIFSHVPSTKVREIAAMLKAIHASEDIVAAREKAVRVIDKLRGLRLANC